MLPVLLSSSHPAARCFPRCRNGALCRQSNRCVCRRGFHGSRCEFSQLTSIPHQLSVHNISEPTINPQKITKAAGRRVMAARAGPADVLPRPASIRTTSKPRAADLNPSSSPAENHSNTEAAEIPSSGSGHFGFKTEETGDVHKRYPVEFNHLQPWTENSQERAGTTEKTRTSDSQTREEETLNSHSEKRAANIPHTQSTPESRTEEREEGEESKVTLGLKQSSRTEDTREIRRVEKLTTSKISNQDTNLRPKGEQGQQMESNSGLKVKEMLNVRTEFDSRSKDEDERLRSSKISDLESNPDHPGLRGAKSLDVGESWRKEEKRPTSEEKRKEVEAAGEKPSLR